MSKRSVRSSSRAGSVKTSGKATGGKKQEVCAQCSKANTNLRLLDCSHAFCPECLKTIPTKDPDDKEKDARSSKMSKKGTAPKEGYVCPICNKPETPEQDFTHGECAPCK